MAGLSVWASSDGIFGNGDDQGWSGLQSNQEFSGDRSTCWTSRWDAEEVVGFMRLEFNARAGARNMGGGYLKQPA